MDAPTPTILARVADHIDGGGIELLPSQLLSELVVAARAADASEVVIGVLVDPTEPAVARERAFVKLASRIVGHGGSPVAPVLDGAHAVVLAA
jgi:hypothetical protein